MHLQHIFIVVLINYSRSNNVKICPIISITEVDRFEKRLGSNVGKGTQVQYRERGTGQI